MTFNDAASFSSISLAKEEAAIRSTEPVERKPRFPWRAFIFPAIAFYLISMGVASVAFYDLGVKHERKLAAEATLSDWKSVLPPRGQWRDRNNDVYEFNEEGKLAKHVYSLETALGLPKFHVEHSELGQKLVQTGPFPRDGALNHSPITIIASSTIKLENGTKLRKRGGSGDDDDDESGPPVAKPAAVQGGYPPYAVGDDPYGYSGAGDRAYRKGQGRRKGTPKEYYHVLEIPNGPDKHLANPTHAGGLRIHDPLVPRPTHRVKDAPVPDEGGYIPKPVYLDSNPNDAAPAPTPEERTGGPRPTPVVADDAKGSFTTRAPSPFPSPVGPVVTAIPAPPVVTHAPASAKVSVNPNNGSVSVKVIAPTPSTVGTISYVEASPKPAPTPNVVEDDGADGKPYFVVTLTLPIDGVYPTPIVVAAPAPAP
ncbi:hypothetical protein V8F20_002733 [Naviculisporaceae sp. PSN 640]